MAAKQGPNEPKVNDFLTTFCQLTEDMLSTLHDSFPECQGTEQCLNLYQKFAKTNLNTMINGINAWYHVMSPLTSSLRDPNEGFLYACQTLRTVHGTRNIQISSLVMTLMTGNKQQKADAVKEFCHPVSMLEMLKLEDKWNQLAPDAREYLLMYIVYMNAYAILYNIVPQSFVPDVLSMLRGDQTGSNILTSILSNTSSEGNSESLFRDVPAEEMQHFMTNVQDFGLACECLGAQGISSIQNMMKDIGLPEDAMSPQSMQQVQAVMKSLPPGTMDKLTKAIQEGNMSEFMNPETLQMIAGACQQNNISIQEIVQTIDISKLMGHIQSSGAMNDPNISSLMQGVMGSGGAAGLLSGVMGSGGAAGLLGSGGNAMSALGNMDPNMLQSMMSAMSGTNTNNSDAPNAQCHDDML